MKIKRTFFFFLVGLFWSSFGGCSPQPRDVDQQSQTKQRQRSSNPQTKENSQPSTPIPRKRQPSEKDFPGLHNLLQITDDLYSGGEPHEEKAFASLVNLGVKTVVSVDGAKPNIKLARKYGLKYVHVPIGYDGIHDHAQKSFARVAKDAKRPLYIHCHHGRHRGPAAAAAICIACGEADGRAALKILRRAGTSKEYRGLWRDVEQYKVPKLKAKLPKLVEIAEVESVAAAMAKIDRAYDNLKLCRKTNWKTPPKHPDLEPAQEALLLREAFYELRRNLRKKHDPKFKTWMAESEALTSKLESALKSEDRKAASRHFLALQESCKRCHAHYRN